MAESPSLRHHLESSYLKAYRYAVLRVTQETLDETALPKACPFTWEQIVDEGYWPD